MFSLIRCFLLLLLLASRVSSSNSKRTRRASNTHDMSNEVILDEEHLIELLKRLKQQAFDDYSNLLETLISKPFSGNLSAHRLSSFRTLPIIC